MWLAVELLWRGTLEGCTVGCTAAVAAVSELPFQVEHAEVPTRCICTLRSYEKDHTCVDVRCLERRASGIYAEGTSLSPAPARVVHRDAAGKLLSQVLQCPTNTRGRSPHDIVTRGTV